MVYLLKGHRTTLVFTGAAYRFYFPLMQKQVYRCRHPAFFVFSVDFADYPRCLPGPGYFRDTGVHRHRYHDGFSCFNQCGDDHRYHAGYRSATAFCVLWGQFIADEYDGNRGCS